MSQPSLLQPGSDTEEEGGSMNVSSIVNHTAILSYISSVVSVYCIRCDLACSVVNVDRSLSLSLPCCWSIASAVL